MMWRKAMLLEGVQATGTGTEVSLSLPMKDHVMQVDFTNSGGGVTGLVVDLEGSLNGASWSSLGTLTFEAGDLSAETAQLVVQTTPQMAVRANVTTLTETGTTAVSATYLGMS